MSIRTYLVLFAVACLVIGGCTIPSAVTNVEPGTTPAQLATLPTGVTPSAQAPTAIPAEPTPTNTLVVPPASPPPEIKATEQPGAPTPEAPIPTALVDPDLVALWEYSQALGSEVSKPLQEMVAVLEGLGLGSGTGDIVAICTGVDAVVGALPQVQQGLEQVGAPPVDDADLQLAYAEFALALDDLEQGFALLQSACQDMNLGALTEAAAYLESGSAHMENASAAIERWEQSVGL